MGGDADTLVCIAGGVAEYGGVPKPIANPALAILEDNLRSTVARFYERYGPTQKDAQDD